MAPRPRVAVGVALATMLGAGAMTTPTTARAEGAVSGTGKGIVGGALLGAEVGFVGLSAAGARATWLYLAVPGALAIGGGIAGWQIEKSAKAEIPLYMLAGGMALVIPSVVITLSANAYRPRSSEDGTPFDATPAEAGRASVGAGVGVGGSAGGATSGGTPSTVAPGAGGAPATPPPTTAPPGAPKRWAPPTSFRTAPRSTLALVNVEGTDALQVGVPLLTVAPMYTQSEVAQFGVTQRYEVKAQLFAIAF